MSWKPKLGEAWSETVFHLQQEHFDKYNYHIFQIRNEHFPCLLLEDISLRYLSNLPFDKP